MIPMKSAHALRISHFLLIDAVLDNTHLITHDFIISIRELTEIYLFIFKNVPSFNIYNIGNIINLFLLRQYNRFHLKFFAIMYAVHEFIGVAVKEGLLVYESIYCIINN